MFSVLHTWSQQLNLHPHVHCVVPAGGLSPDHTRWVRSRDNYFIPKKVLRKVFRGKFVDALKQAFHNGQLNFPTDLKLLANPKTFAAPLRTLFRENWVVYLKPPFGGPEYVLHYLGRYTHRVAISNHRLLSFADGQVTFRWRDSADGNKQPRTATSKRVYRTRAELAAPAHSLARKRIRSTSIVNQDSRSSFAELLIVLWRRNVYDL